MPIPGLDENGLLPSGVHDCTLEELNERFGNDRLVDNKVSPCRSRLYTRLCEYVREIRRLKYVVSLLVDGSFVTDKPQPEDIDLVVVLAADHDFTKDLRPFEYNLLSKRRVKQNRYLFDIRVVSESMTEYAEAVAFFSQVRNRPELTKGLLRVKP
jgi:hypothetical protein